MWSDQERSQAQADLERLTGELVRLYQLREQLRMALGEAGETAGAPQPESGPPVIRVIHGKREGPAPVDGQQRSALRAQFQVIRGGLAGPAEPPGRPDQ
jgi:hypothetical protein